MWRSKEGRVYSGVFKTVSHSSEGREEEREERKRTFAALFFPLLLSLSFALPFTATGGNCVPISLSRVQKAVVWRAARARRGRGVREVCSAIVERRGQ